MPPATHTNLKQARAERNLSTRRLGAALGVSGETVRLWSIGQHRPHARHRPVLEAMFGMTIDELLAPAPDQNANSTGREPGAVGEKPHHRPAKTERVIA